MIILRLVFIIVIRGLFFFFCLFEVIVDKIRGKIIIKFRVYIKFKI